MAFITAADIRHRHLSTDDIHQINKSIKPFVADKKSASVQFDSREDANDLWLEETGLLFFPSLPEMKPSVLMMLAGMSTMLMWESVMRMHTTALAPGLLVKRDLNIQKWHRGLSHVKPETLTITGGWHGRELKRRATPRSFVSGGVTHTPERRHTPCINQSPRYMPSVPPYNTMMTLSTNFHIDTIIYGICRSNLCSHSRPSQQDAWTSLNRVLWKSCEVKLSMSQL